MPERRKMKSPSPKMTSTPKVKRKEMDTESTEELQKRLGYSDNLAQRKEFSTPDSVEFTEYNDGTTRPMFKKRLKSVTAKSGETAQLECTVSGSPLPKILWLKNNRPLKASDGCKVIVDEGTNILVFPKARDEDVGIYTARAMNVNGSIMCSAEFTLSDGRGLPAQPVTDSPMDMDFTTPAYFFQMSSCEVSEGRLARFDCRVVAYPKPEIVWMRDGKVIEAEQRFKLLNFNNEIYSLLIQDVRTEDTGRYTCWARNKFGEAMTEAYLNVLALADQEPEGDLAPKFLTRFYDQQTTEGTATDFKCLIAGRPEPSVTWLLDDLEIREGQGVRMRHKDGMVSLEIKSPKVDQSGTYTCQLSNPLGEATCSARLTVVEDKLHGKMLPKFLKKFDHVTAKEGEEANFTAVIIGEPRPDVMWLYDHKPISDTNRRFMMKKEGDAYTLTIKNVRFDDGGKITCKASNEEGEVYCSANLHVRESKFMTDLPEKIGGKSQDEVDSKFGYIPTFTKRLQDLEVKEGSRATFECRVMGIPDPEISWMKDGRVITPGGRYRMTFEGGTGQLVIDNATAADTGVYTCIVSNSQGKSSSTAALKLEEPKKERYTPDRLLEERTSRKERYTPDKYLLDDSTAAKRPYLDTDRYEDETSKQLDLPEMRAPPRLPTHRPIITDFGEETMRLAWRPVETYQAKRTPPVSYRLEAKELPGRDWMPMSSHLRDTSHYLPDLLRDRDYMIRVRAENDFGISEPTEPLWIPRAKAFPGVPVTRPEIIDYEDTMAKLSWSRVDIPAFGLDDTPLLYMLEVEEPPYKNWRTIARDLDDTEYIVEGLKPGHDYRFRVRAKTPTGIVSEPSPAVSLYTKLAQTRAPVDRLEVLDYEPETRSVRLSWDRVNIPPYDLDDEPLMYMLEYQEPPLPDWKTLVTGIPTTRYRVMHLDRDRDYNFRVRALTPYGVSQPSPTLPVTLRQPTGTPVTRGLPEKVIISEVEAHSLRLTWRRPMYDLDKPIGYQVEMLESPFSDWRPIATRVIDTTYKVTGLKPTRDYQFRVIPQLDTEYLAPTPSAALTTMPVKPRLPYGEPRLKELTPESVQLSWSSAELPAYQRKRSPIHYKVEMAELPSNNWVPVARKVGDTSYTVTGLRPNQEYKFRVFAESDSGLSEPSMPTTLYRRPAPRFPLKEPIIRDLSQNVVHLAWSPAEIPTSGEAVTYMVEVQTPPGISSWNTLYRQHPTPSVRLADLRPDLDYLVRVRAQSGTYLSEPTLPVYIPRRAAPPRLPVEQPYAVEINPDFVKLQWRSADLPTHIQDYAPVTYRLEAQELPDTNWVSIARGIPYTDFKVTGLNPQRDYNFRVRAENEYGLSDPTHPMMIRKRAVPPTLPTYEPMLYDIGPGSARLSWRPATLPSFMPQTPITYTLFVQDLPYKTWRPLVKGIPHTSYYVSGLQPDKEYLFRVQAENQYGSSKPTDSIRLPRYKDYTRPISVPEVSDFDEDLTSVKLRWMPTRVSPPFDTKPRKYTIETWEPVRREWKPVARGVPDTTYQIRGLPKLPDHLFRVRMDTEEPALSEPSMPVSLSRYSLPRAPMYRPQLYELEDESVRLSWQPVSVPEGVSRRSVRYTIEQREIPEPRWSPIATDIMETSHKVRGLRPKSDYEFRVKAMFDGISTEPSYPVSLFRRAVIPKVKLDAPEVYDVEDTSLSLRWNTVDVPAFTPDEEPLLFVIERQTLPSYEWQPVATNISDRSYTIRDLQPYQDYNFRVRGVYPSGYTEPSPYVPVYRRPIRLSVPVARTEVWEEEPTSARLRWHRAYIPRYYSSTPISYRIEMQEAGETDKEWKPVATDITTPDYTVRNISPRKDYRFRIRAKTENGDISEPTPPISFYRTQVPLMKDREQALADYKPVEYKAIFLKHPYYEVLTKYVPPSMPIHKPDMIIIDTETVEINWRPAIVAEAIKYTCNLTYTIEVRCPPSFEWRQLVSGLKICSHTIQKLHPRIDYVFRVRAWNEYGCSEASLPVSLYRPAVYKIEGEEEMDDEEFEIEWKRRYGREVPPKLPIDTPRIVTQSSDSIWFTWLPARIPAYATQTSINYVVEIREPPSTAWQRDATDLVDCQYVKEGLNPNQEYHIRVRAETEFGASDPTMPIIIRGKGSRPGSRRSSVEREERGLEDKIDLSYLDNVMSGVPPRMASSRPLSSCVGPDKLTLSWSPCRTPSYVKASNVTYIIEKRELPGHVWTVLAKDITGHKYDITGLNPEQDYMFRIRARNEFGLSEPTLPMTLYRERDDYVPPKVRSRSGSRDSISMYVSKVMRRSSSVDYTNLQMEDDRSSQERIPCQPQYIPMTYDTQYGVLGKKGKISLEVRGYPLPTVHWYKGEEKIEYGGQFNAFVTPRGGITLEIKNVGLDTVGEYKCYAENASGAAVKMVNFEIAEPPTVLGTIKDLFAFKGDSVTLTCRVDGFPSPTVKWMKDWRPLTDCTRTKMVNVPPETFSLEIVQLIESDEGLYACTVENIAGKVTVTGRLNVEIDSFPEREITIKSTPIEEQYHVLEEIGRGRYGVVRRVVEISTGRTFAANFMSMRNKAQKNFFKTEFEVLRSISKMGGVLKLYDAFETDRSLVLVTEILSEPELLEKVISDGNWTEARVANIIRKLLAILQDLARLNILHLDIKPSNIRTCGTELEDIKLIGFGLSRILQPDEEIMHNYGSVGYASPEQVTNDVLMPNTDMWAVGVLAYLLLSGNGPFQGSSEIEILNFMSECSWTFEGRGFEKFSKEGLDFISKLLVKDPRKRMTVEECLNHPWMSTQSDAKINTEQLKQFYTAEKLQRETEKVFTTVQLQSFAKIIHGTKALYQPAVDIESGEIIFPDSDEYGDYLDEDAWYEWQLQYNDDPDSQNFPIQDKKFTVRECRHAGAPKYSKPKPKERSDTDILDTGTGILFTDKIQPTTFLEGEDVIFTATVVSETGEIPVVTWYRDEQLLSDDYRAEASFSPDTGLAKLKIVKSKDYDAAVYKCVARIKEGRVSCEARLLLGDVPSKPGCPLVAKTSGTEAFLTWNAPVSDGNTYLLGYRVDYRKEGDKKWTNGPYVTEEFALVTGLEPETSYIFRVSGHNRYGASPFSWSSLETKTLGKDAPKVTIAADLQPLLQFSTFDKQQLILPAESRRPSVTVTEEAKVNESDPTENFAFADTISKGSYGEYKLCTNKTTSRQCVAKIVPYNKENHSAITAEFELLRKLRHANLVAVLDSYISGEHFYVIYEFLSGINIVQHLCLHKTYKEETVARLVRQVLDALQYLEHYGIVHLNLQPSSIVMATRRRPHVKLRDFTLARKVEDDKGIKVPLAGYPDYTSPEILKGDSVTFTADLWTLGALTFTMLSGISPFGGKNLEETLSRVLFDRYSTKEMYDNVTEESIKFVQKLLCRLPRNRPTVTKCLNSSWLSLSESMVNARNTKIFKSEKLRAFSVDYLNKRSDINYSLALVDIEKLPKITPGPLVQPVLSEKITNRLENLTKIKREHTSLADSLKTEVSSLPEQPLLEKIVSKIERESENIDKTEVQTVKEESKTSKTTIAEVGGEISDVKITEEEKKVTLAKAQEEIVEGDIDTFEDKESIPTEAEVQEKINETEILSSGTEVDLEVKEHNAVDIKKEIKDDIVVETEMNERIEKTEENFAGTKAEVDTTELKDAESVEQIEKKITPDALEPKDIDSKPEKDKVVVEGTENVDAVDKTEIVEMKENLVMKDMEMNDENIETKNLENLEEITKKSDVVDAELVKVEKVSESSKITEQLTPGDIESNLIENKEHVDVTEMRETVENKVDMKKISDGQEKDIVVDNKSQKDIKVVKELAEGTEETKVETEETSDVKLIMKSEGERKDINVEIERKETKKTKDELQKTELEAASIEKTKAKEKMLMDAALIEKKEGESETMMVEKKIGDTESKETEKTMGELQKTELEAASVEEKKAKEDVLLDAELIEKEVGESKTMKEEKKIGEEIKTKEELLKSGVKETIDEEIKPTEKEVLHAGFTEKEEDKSTVLRDEPLEVNEIKQKPQKEDVDESVVETTKTTDGEVLDAGLIEEKEKEISAETKDNKIREMVDEKFEKSDLKESSDEKETTEDEIKDMAADNKEVLTTNVKDQLQKETLSKEIQEVVEKDKADIKERELQTTYVEETKESKETSENIGKVKGTELDQIVETAITEVQKEVISERNEETVIETDVTSERKVLKDITSALSQNESFEASEEKINFTEEKEEITDKSLGLQRIDEVNTQQQGQAIIENEIVTEREKDSIITSETVSDKISETEQITKLEQQENELSSADKSLSQTVSSETKEVSKEVGESSTGSKGCEIEAKIQTEKKEIVETQLSENLKQDLSLEIVEKQTEILHDETKSTVFHDKSKQEDSEIKSTTTCDTDELISGVSELAEREAKEIKRAAFEEIATVLKASKEMEDLNVQKQEEIDEVKEKITISDNETKTTLKQADEIKNLVYTEDEIIEQKSSKEVETKKTKLATIEQSVSEYTQSTEVENISKDECVSIAMSKMVSEKVESVSVVKEGTSDLISVEKKEETLMCLSEKDITETKNFDKVETMSASETKESISEVEEKQISGILENVEKEVQAETSEGILSTDSKTSVESVTMKDETASASALVTEQVDGTVTEKITVSKKHESLAVDGHSAESAESVSSMSTMETQKVEESCILESTGKKEVVSEQRQESLSTGNMVLEKKEAVEMVSTSLVEDLVVQSSVSSSLETARVTESRETVREFVTNDDEIEEMKKEILEDLEITSAECGKYLMGSHEDISAIKEKIELKPDEEEIEKETTNRYIDDALMFC